MDNVQSRLRKSNQPASRSFSGEACSKGPVSLKAVCRMCLPGACAGKIYAVREMSRPDNIVRASRGWENRSTCGGCAARATMCLSACVCLQRRCDECSHASWARRRTMPVASVAAGGAEKPDDRSRRPSTSAPRATTAYKRANGIRKTVLAAQRGLLARLATVRGW